MQNRMTLCRILDTDWDSPKVLCITLLPLSSILNNTVTTRITTGFSLASQATMIAVKPTPPETPSPRV
jgi:hypothetical protein